MYFILKRLLTLENLFVGHVISVMVSIVKWMVVDWKTFFVLPTLKITQNRGILLGFMGPTIL